MKRIGLLIGLVFVLVLPAIAQRTDILEKDRFTRIDSLLSDVLFGDDELYDLFSGKKNFQFLYAGANYNSKTYFAGREIGTDQYNFSGQLYYMHSIGFFAGVSGSWYSQLDPGYRTTVFSAGFGKGFKKIKFLRYRASLDYFLFNVDDPDFDALYNSSLNAGITLKSKSLGTRLDGSLLMGQEFGQQLSWDVYAYLNLIKFSRYDYLRLEPEVSLFWGSEAAEFLLNEAYVDEITQTEVSTYYKDVFGLLNIQLQLPVSLSWKSFDLEVSYNYNLPQTIGDGESYSNSSYFRISLGYIFNL
ncbi:hypothetical protein [Mangrovibacterium diazotrophicum]|uniref:Uncharacterized protein n=1 Tax=Mangrovibacterium diazotrophicum TaxID=1261403 RepID=A0A419W770_9BACT|nr:hypothetical protein [Mangrovibacterium diazotrophicum]RKD91296.1 hypothetical protein BC643_1649 [Mangrovibacterium diazotrophicum]